jgi:hypothetical protein
VISRITAARFGSQSFLFDLDTDPTTQATVSVAPS